MRLKKLAFSATEKLLSPFVSHPHCNEMLKSKNVCEVVLSAILSSVEITVILIA